MLYSPFEDQEYLQSSIMLSVHHTSPPVYHLQNYKNFIQRPLFDVKNIFDFI